MGWLFCPMVFLLLVVVWVQLAPWLLLGCTWLLFVLGWLSCSPRLLLRTLFCTLLMAQVGYLHLPIAFLRCLSSFWRSSGSVQTVFVPWVSVPMTLYLADRLWWLSHCKCWSVWVGFQYTVMDREASALQFYWRIKERYSPISLCTFHCKLDGWINFIYVFQEFLFTGLFLNDPCVIHKPIPYPGEFAADLSVSPSKYSMYKLATMGLTGDHIAAPSTRS